MTEWSQSIVAFLDILGYKELIRQDVHQKMEFYKQIYAVIQKAPSFTILTELDVHQFSDSIVIRTDFRTKTKIYLRLRKQPRKFS